MTDLSSLSSLERALTFYEVYHSEWRNKLIHFIFVPILLYTGFSMVYYYAPYITISAFIGYSVYYIYVDPVIGLSYVPIMIMMLNNVKSISFLSAFLIHVSSWIVQILSHKYFEGNAPALTKGLFQAITIAPLFTWYELFRIFGYRKIFFNRIETNAKLIQEK